MVIAWERLQNRRKQLREEDEIRRQEVRREVRQEIREELRQWINEGHTLEEWVNGHGQSNDSQPETP